MSILKFGGEKSSNGISNMSLVIAQIYVAESLLIMKSLFQVSFNKIFNGFIPDDRLSIIKNIQNKMALETDIISLKQELADFVYTQKEYPF